MISDNSPIKATKEKTMAASISDSASDENYECMPAKSRKTAAAKALESSDDEFMQESVINSHFIELYIL